MVHRSVPITTRRRSEGSIDLESLSFAFDPYGRPVLAPENELKERKRNAAARRRMTSRMRGYLSEDDDHLLLSDKAARVRAEIARRRKALLNSEIESRLAQEAAAELEEARIYQSHLAAARNALISPSILAAYYGTTDVLQPGYFTDELLDYRDIDAEDALVYDSHVLPGLSPSLGHQFIDPRIARSLTASRMARLGPGYLSRSLDAGFDDYYDDFEYYESDPRFIDPMVAAYHAAGISKSYFNVSSSPSSSSYLFYYLFFQVKYFYKVCSLWYLHLFPSNFYLFHSFLFTYCMCICSLYFYVYVYVWLAMNFRVNVHIRSFFSSSLELNTEHNSRTL